MTLEAETAYRDRKKAEFEKYCNQVRRAEKANFIVSSYNASCTVGDNNGDQIND